MKSKKWLVSLLALTLAGTMAFSACGGGDNGASSSVGGGDSSVSAGGGDSSVDESTGDSSVEDSTGDSSDDSQEWSAPVIAVTPAEVSINAGDEIDLMLGVTVMDEYDTDLVATIADDDMFDATVEGTYTITYSATNSKGKTATATRTITVTAPKANIHVEVPYNRSIAAVGTVLAFPNNNYYPLTDDATYDAAYSGIYHNVSSETILVDIVGGSGEVAILDASGKVIEGRDGANAHFVNVDNPTRASGPNTFTYNGNPYNVSANCARFMQIPAGGIAVVVFQNFAGTSFNEDGRKFVCDNLVGEYGLMASVYLNDGESAPYTTYVNQAPTVKAPAAVNVTVGKVTQDDVDVMVKAGLEIKDDGGTFAPSDDITSGWEVTITDRGGFDANTAGEYTYTCTVTDGTLTTQFTRLVKVVSNTMSVLVEGSTEKTFDKDRVCVNQAAGNYANWDLCIYTKSFTGTLTDNAYGAAMIIGTDGKIKAVYDGANGNYLNATNIGSGYGASGIVTAQNYLTKAWEELQAGEILLVGANGSASNATRSWILGFRRKTADPVTTWIGTNVTISGITIA